MTTTPDPSTRGPEDRPVERTSAWDTWHWAPDSATPPGAAGPTASIGAGGTAPQPTGPHAIPAQVPVGVGFAPAGGAWTGVHATAPGAYAAPGRGRGPGWAALLITSGVAALTAALIGGAIGAGVADRGVFGRVAPPTAGAGATARPEGSIANVAAKALPSVVTIRADSATSSATGSGFVYDNAGHVITNNHVVDGVGESILVVLSNGERLKATVVGTDPAYDVAVLATKGTALTPLILGDSNAVVVGDEVIAVGAPLGLDSTVTSGIVSAVNRPVVAGNSSSPSYINAIQTDAAINPGNSGGPLLDMAGHVIGVNSAIAQTPSASGGTGGNIGLGFAIPSDQVRKTAEQLISKGSAEHPVIGVLLDSQFAGPGAKVQASDGSTKTVIAGGPADKAGLKPGDVIVAFDGRPVSGSDDLIVAIRAHSVGDRVPVTVRRGTRTIDVTMILQAAPKK